MNTRRMTLLIAIVLALGTGYLTISYLGSLRAEAPQQVTMRTVIVAGQDIPARAKITAEMLKVEQRNAAEVDPDAVVDGKQAVGTLALITIPAGGAITQSKIGRPVDIGLTPRLQPGMRAVSIGIDRVKGVSGLVQPGDRVDVIAIPPKVTNHPKAYTIMRGAIVLALGNELEQAGATPAPGAQDLTTVTLEVTPKQADMLAMADLNTTLRLALRAPKENVRSFPTEQLVFENTENNGAGGGGAAAPAPASNVPPPYMFNPGPPHDQGSSNVAVRPRSDVTVIDGDKVVQGQ
jgi:pilus assembly protein CpaB